MFDAAIAADPTDPSTYIDGAAALDAAGNLAGAAKLLAAYAKALPPTARYHLARAHLLTRQGDPAAARAEESKAAELDPAQALVRSR